MYRDRARIAVFLMVLYSIPTVALAACPSGYKEYSVWSAAGAQDKLKELTENSSNNPCSDEAVILQREGYVCHKIFPSACVAGQTSRCQSGNSPATVKVTLPKDFGGKTYTFNKCDKKSLLSAIDETAKSGSPSALERLASKSGSSLTLAPGQSISTRGLIERAASDPASAAAQRAAQNPALKTALVVGDPGGIQRAGREAGLSDDEIARLIEDRKVVRPAGSGSGQPEISWTAGGQGAYPGQYPGALLGTSGMGGLGGIGQLLASLISKEVAPASSAGSGSGSGGTGANPSQSTNAAAASVLVQPKVLAAPGHLLVSWTSVGMKGNGCALFEGEGGARIKIAERPEGSIRIPVTTRGEVTILMKCTPLSGDPVERTERIEVR